MSRFHGIWFLIFGSLIFTANAERDLTVCNIEKENNGLIPPALPKNFELKGEKVEYEAKQLSWEEVYFDNDNQQGEYVILANGTELHGIVNYDVGQAAFFIRLHPGAKEGRDPLSMTCTAEKIEDSFLKKIFGYRRSNKDLKRSRMFNSNEALRFGGPHPYSYQGFKYFNSRGLNTSIFRGCIYDKDDDQTAKVLYYFSDQDTVPAGGTPEEVVDGIKDQGLSVPLAFEATGVMMDSEHGKQIPIKFNVTQSISWFKGEPEFGRDVFRLPEWTYCKDYRGSKKIPKLPTGFSVRYELSSFTQDMEGKSVTGRVYLVDMIYYDYEKKLARLDFTPLEEKDSEIISLFQSNEPVRTVFDYNTGIKYIVHKNTGRCFAKPIGKNDDFDTSNEDTYLKMGSPEEVLHMQTDDDAKEYKGKAVVRDILTDVWNGKYFMTGANQTVFKEVYMTTDGWHEETEDALQFGIPVRLAVLANREEDGETRQIVTEMNFFKFKPTAPQLVTYDITGCIEQVEHKFLAIVISVPPVSQDILMRLRYDVKQVAQAYIAEASQLGTPLRVQRVTLKKAGSSLVITFAILGKITLKTNVPYGQKGPTIEDAVDNLRKHINAGKFSFKFTPPAYDDFKKPDDINIFANPNSLQQFDPKSFFVEPVYPKPTKMPSNEIFREDKKPVTDSKPKPKKGMPAGGLAALSIVMLLLGIAIGITLMYLYIKKFSRSNPNNQIPMSKQ